MYKRAHPDLAQDRRTAGHTAARVRGRSPCWADGGRLRGSAGALGVRAGPPRRVRPVLAFGRDSGICCRNAPALRGPRNSPRRNLARSPTLKILTFLSSTKAATVQGVLQGKPHRERVSAVRATDCQGRMHRFGVAQDAWARGRARRSFLCATVKIKTDTRPRRPSPRKGNDQIRTERRRQDV